MWRGGGGGRTEAEQRRAEGTGVEIESWTRTTRGRCVRSQLSGVAYDDVIRAGYGRACRERVVAGIRYQVIERCRGLVVPGQSDGEKGKLSEPELMDESIWA